MIRRRSIRMICGGAHRFRYAGARAGEALASPTRVRNRGPLAPGLMRIG